MPRRNLQILVVTIVVCLLCAYRSSRYTRVLTYALEQIQLKALEPKPAKELTEAALRGMTGVLDSYSAYISEEEVPKFEEELDRQFAGVGLEIFLDPQSQRLRVASPLPNTPAQRAGIKPGDYIIAIDGQPTKGLTLEEAGKKMRGEPGTQVTLSVQTPGEEKPRDLVLLREIIRAETILGDTRNPDGTWNYVLQSHPEIGYIRIATFGEETSEQLKKIILDLKAKNIRGLILDLRDNPGGRLEEAVAVCDLFIESGVIVTTRYRNGQIKKRYMASGNAVFPDLPMSVLINHFSASASEIVAACLQDHGRATIVGERSFGKGTVQELIPLEAGLGMLKLTTAAYWRPSGKQIHRMGNAGEDQQWGVTPDPGLEVKLDRAEQDMLIRYRALRDVYLPPGSPKPAGFDSVPEDFRDRQLEAAVAALDKKKKVTPQN